MKHIGYFLVGIVIALLLFLSINFLLNLHIVSNHVLGIIGIIAIFAFLIGEIILTAKSIFK